MSQHIIIIDDDPVSISIVSYRLQRKYKQIDIHSFLNGKEGIDYLNKYANDLKDGPTCILLDINMPVMNGWEFLHAFESLDAEIQKQINIYILSSSVDKQDVERAQMNPRLKGFLHKPIDEEDLKLVDQFMSSANSTSKNL